MRTLIAIFLAFCAFSLILAEKIVVPGLGVYGKCSKGKLKQVIYEVKLDKAITGAYLLPKVEYDKVVAASKSANNTVVNFNYFNDQSCIGGSVTSCSKDSNNTNLGNESACVALVNAGSNETSNGDFMVKFIDENGLVRKNQERPEMLDGW